MDFEVIVIGSGFAGSGCAELLEEKNVNYIVFEADDHTGGRTNTITFENDNSYLDIDTGACFIHGTQGNPLDTLCNKHFIPYKYFEGSNHTIRVSDFPNPLPNKQVSLVNNTFRELKKKAKLYLHQEYAKGNTKLSLEDGFQFVLKETPLSWNEDSPEHHHFNYRKWVYEEFEGANWDEMSILQLEESQVFPGGNVMIKDGYGPLVEALQSNLKIRTNSEVKKIEYSDNSATVTVLHHYGGGNSEYKVYTCNYVVFTASLGVLKESLNLSKDIILEEIEKGLIKIEPSFPDWKKESLDCMTMGLMNKVIMQFDTKFWGQVSRIVYCGKEAGDFPWFDMQDGEVPVILAWTACRYADKYEREMKNDNDVIEHCMSIIRKAFPDAPNPCCSYVTRWRTNPLTRGAYSFLNTNATREKLQKLNTPVNTIYFAGEAFAGPHIGCVHGAYITGREVANTITSLLKK